MDINKQPGVKCESIILAESLFRRQAQIPENFRSHVSFNVKNMLSKKVDRATCELTVTVNNENDPVYMKIVFMGIFIKEEDINNMSMHHFIENYAPAVIVPYAREEIHNRTMKAGLPNIILPPVNIPALIKDKSTGQKLKDM